MLHGEKVAVVTILMGCFHGLKAKIDGNNLKILYDFCIPKDLRNCNLLIIIALEIGGYLSLPLRQLESRSSSTESGRTRVLVIIKISSNFV